ncbi:MAG TPA: hypothetical protein VK834_09720, partial [Bradyrhizobium sp.]|nr:hypothetical protein [Bradyrhizobium sp.]
IERLAPAGALDEKINNRLNQIKILIKLGFWTPVLFFSYIEIGVSRDEFAGDSPLQRGVTCELDSSPRRPCRWPLVNHHDATLVRADLADRDDRVRHANDHGYPE